MGEFVIVAKFGDRVLRRLASSLFNVIRQAGRQADKNSSLGDFFRIRYLEFGYYLVVLNQGVRHLGIWSTWFGITLLTPSDSLIPTDSVNDSSILTDSETYSLIPDNSINIPVIPYNSSDPGRFHEILTQLYRF